MASFKDLDNPKEIKKYLVAVLRRMSNNNEKYLYHYSSFESIYNIVETGYIWLGLSKNMNDFLENEFIESVEGRNRMYFSCFSGVEENLALYKMYAAPPDGAMLAISIDIAKMILRDSFDSKNKKHVSLIVRDNNLTRDEVASSMYWTEVAYKELYDNKISTKGAYNEKIENPLNIEEFAGFIKLRGWAYEREIRLTSVVEEQLKENERVAIRLPQGFRKNIQIVTVPGFDKTKYKDKISRLKRIGVDIKSSEYDEMVDLMSSVDGDIKKRISEIELENIVLRNRLQNNYDIKDTESVIEMKNTLENELVDKNRASKYRKRHIIEHEPWKKFSFNNIILRAIGVYNPTYNKGLIKRELYDFYDEGILVFSPVCSKKITTSGKSNEEVKTMKKDVYVVDAVPFCRIFMLDIKGNKNYPYPTLYCRFENGNPFIEEWYIDKYTGIVYEKHLI